MSWLLLFLGLVVAGLGVRIGVIRLGTRRHPRLRARMRLLQSQRRTR